MDNQELLKKLSTVNESKIVLVVADGLGGLPKEDGKTELEAAKTPNLDDLAARSICGLMDPILPGVTPGSGPAHLSLFGYDPLRYEIGRGILEVLGAGLSPGPKDLAARGNFATINTDGVIIDRRAGRITTEKNVEFCQLLDGIEIEGVKVTVAPVKEHRFAAIFQGEDLYDELTDSDPQRIGLEPLLVLPLIKEAERTAQMVNRFIDEAKRRLSEHYPANMVLFRGFAKNPQLPTFQELYQLNPSCIATYPMYRGLARLLGMELLPTGETLEAQIETLKEYFKDYDFFYLHFKKPDSKGEDGNFEGRVKDLEELDKYIPSIVELNPEVLVVTGDHSTPAKLKSHSWHPVPVLLWSKFCRQDQVTTFGETACIQGGLGRLSAIHLMPLMLANAQKLKKFGA
ncbi:TPA: phosphoglycerate mutase [bacterium]|nr:phosphoglycerate mutase [bacterium]